MNRLDQIRASQEWRPKFYLPYRKIMDALPHLSVYGHYQFSKLEIKLVMHFINSMNSIKHWIDLTEQRYRTRTEWKRILKCSDESYVSRLFNRLEKKEVIYTVKTVASKTYRSLHPKFLTALLIFAEGIRCVDLQDELQSTAPESTDVDNGDNSSGAEDRSPPLEGDSVHPSSDAESTPEGEVSPPCSYIENPSPIIPSPKTPVLISSSPSHPQVDNSKAFDLAKRFDIRFNLPGESFEDVAAWFDDRLKNWEIPELELFLKFANTQKPILTVIKGKTHPPRKKLFEQFMVWMNRETVVAGGISC